KQAMLAQELGLAHESVRREVRIPGLGHVDDHLHVGPILAATNCLLYPEPGRIKHHPCPPPPRRAWRIAWRRAPTPTTSSRVSFSGPKTWASICTRIKRRPSSSCSRANTSF